MPQILRTYLLTLPAIAAIVGARVYRGSRDQASALPCLVIHRISGADDYALGGLLDMTESRIQIDALAVTAVAADALAEAVRAALSGFRGTMGAARVGQIECVGKNDSFARPALGEARGPATRSFDYLVHAA